MAQVVASHAVAAFSSPVNATSPIDANTVRGNDNALRLGYVNHDADPGIHLQSSTLASRPAASSAGRKWLTADASSYRLFFDDGTTWQELSYLRTDAGGTITGNLTLTGNLSVEGNTTLGNANTDTVTVTGRVASNVQFATDNTHDIGASGANRARDVYAARSVIGPAGSVSQAAFTTQGDLNTGVYFPAADVVGEATAGVERRRTTATGYTKMSNDGTYLSATGAYHEFVNSQGGNNALIVTSSSAIDPNGVLVRFPGIAPNNTTQYFLQCGDLVGEKATIRSNGGLANFSTNNVNLSDARVKSAPEPLGSYWAKFKAIEVVKYKYLDQTHDDWNIGFIAQQVEQHAPEFVDVDGWGGEVPEDGIPLKSIYEPDIHNAAVGVLQEAMARIEALEARLATAGIA